MQLQVPDDVSILFADDNWGNIMSVLPSGKEHKAGAGIYYHVDCMFVLLGIFGRVMNPDDELRCWPT